MTMRTTRRNIALAAATGLAALCLLTTACTADGGKTGTGSETVSDEGKKADQALEHRKCLREQGLDVPEPEPGEEGVGLTIGGDGMSKEKMEKAFKACRDKGGAGMGKELTQADKDKMIKYAQCMRKNGVDMPDPKFEGGGAVSAARPATQGAEKEKFDEANKACESVSR
ncbi:MULTISPECIES: hypothetical protein [unclassified Streptomyces]|uniref:hypothetical protein n=1 Tax=unclassified Streptomyces TaxID=2593676 RepID=UPI0006AE3BA4|nr:MULTISPECIES: hypothetical protein [unclassified Streptomyces]KOX20680.1 hypothetical protein ADL06_27150 [Streptomyces sp. NRRL F-6491]KOX45461.1 hypothetical protein ADL08_13740 [Streptomyces sp. NRRL F-6492]